MGPVEPYNHKIKIKLNKEDTLSYSPLYQQSTAKLQAIKQYFINNLNKGFIKPSQAPFNLPILFTKKLNRGLYFYINYHKLNNITRKDRYPLPLLNKTLAQISRAKIFTKLDIRQAFYQIRIDPRLEDLTIFQTRYRIYKYKVLPFRLTNGPAIYQQYINNILFNYLDDFYIAYLDNIIIYSKNKLEYKEHVYKVL